MFLVFFSFALISQLFSLPCLPFKNLFQLFYGKGLGKNVYNIYPPDEVKSFFVVLANGGNFAFFVIFKERIFFSNGFNFSLFFLL